MKSIIIFIMVFLLQNSFACMGGILPINDKVTLYGSSLVVDGETYEAEVGKKFNSGGADIEVLYIKGDPGGTLYTIYKVKTSKGSKNIKIKTNYAGNGVVFRGLVLGVPEVDQTVGCGSH